MNGWTDGWFWSWAPCLNLNHGLCVYSRAVALKWAVREMFGQCVKQRAVQHMLSLKMFSHCILCRTVHGPAAAAAAAVGGFLCGTERLTRHDSLQIPLTDEVPNGVKVSECVAVSLHPSPLCNSQFPLLLLFLTRSLRLSIHPSSLPLDAPPSSQIRGTRLASSAGSEMTFKLSSVSMWRCTMLSVTCETLKIMENYSIGYDFRQYSSTAFNII